ncbi:MAG: ABC transporter permease [Armatimonadota bacterium]|jgi:putative ABC transport system permease protein
MTFTRLVLRGLAHYRRTAAVVAAGIAVATAVIVGSLVIGDSIEGSIRHTALARLGAISDAVTAPRFFRADLADDAAHEGLAAALILLDASARPQTGDTVVAGVSVVGAGVDLWRLYPGEDPPSLTPRSAIINEALATDAGVEPGDTLLITVSRPGQAMAGTLFARRERAGTLATLRVTVEAVLPDLGPGGFRLDPSTAMPRNVIVDREWLASQIGEQGRANTLVFERPQTSQQRDQIARSMTLADHGLYLREHAPWLSVFSEAVALSDAQVAAAPAAASDLGETSRTSVYLADTIVASADSSRSTSYAVIADVTAADLPLGETASVAQLGEGDLILNAWAAEDLGASVGERFTITWRVSTPSGYEDRSAELTLAAIAPMRGLGADPDLVPDFEGITDAEHIDDWDPPFPVDLSLVTDRDDEYWERHRAAPKAFVGSALLRRMWQGEADDGPWITSVRIGPLPGGAQMRSEYEPALLAELAPEDAGMRFFAVREQALAASKGTSDFGQLFLGMSIFLVLAGAGLAGTLMRLSAERRASQAGIMLATGFTAKRTGRVIAAEGAALSALSVAVGAPLGIAYARLIIAALATRWQGALGDAPVLGVYVEPLSVVIGTLAALLVGLIATWWGARVLSGRAVVELLRGWQATATAPTQRRPWTALATPLLLVAAAGIFVAALAGAIPAEGAFFGIGGALLVAALTGAHLLLTRAMARTGATRSPSAFSLRAAASARGRSLLLLGLIAAATFVIVTVAANSRDFSAIDVRDRASGTGGFALIATSSVPLRFDPATEEGRENLGFLPDEQEALEGVEIISLPRSPGEDISCLNVARPGLPRLLGVTEEMIERGGFTFTSTAGGTDGTPWALLRGETADGALPAVTDIASLQWQLHSAVGETFDAGGDRPPLRFVGAFSGSIFQSEILIHADALRAMHPEIEGPSYFLIDAPDGREDQVADALRAALGEMGVDVRSTREVLNRYISVQNTYLTMFLALGGLGLVLGTFGLVAVILRSAFERRAEFGLMLATGFTRANLTRLVLVENAGLLIAGMVVGTSAALVSVAPHLASAQADVHWGALGTVLAAILVVGLAACTLGARAAVRGELIEALRTE